jgi:rRNA maturation endonuclease Nob1
MQLSKKISKNIEFTSNISEITSICLDVDYNIEESLIKGILNLEGDYISSDTDIKEDFTYKIDFNIDLMDNMDTNTIKLSIDDFTYNIDTNNLIINVDLIMDYEVKLFENKIDFDTFMDSKQIDIDNIDEYSTREEDIEEIEEIKEDTPREIQEEHCNSKNENIINIASSSEDEFITYHIHIVSEIDTLDNIANKYHVSIDTIKEYNDVDNIKIGMKLVIPISHE